MPVAKKRIFAVFILLMLWSTLVFGEARTVRVGVFEAAPLVMVRDGTETGLFIDLLRHIAKVKSWNLEFVPDTWGNLQDRLQRGEIDILPALGFTAGRALVYDFNRHPLYIDSGVVFAGPHLTLHTVFDLEGKRVAALKDSMFTTGFLEYMASFGIHCEMVYTKDNREVMASLAKGTVDAGVCIYSLGNELAKEYPVYITPISFSPLALQYAVAKGKNQELLQAINSTLEPMLTDPDSIYSQLFDHWARRAEIVKVPAWVFWSLGLLLLTGLLILFWNLSLRSQVVRQTRRLQAEVDERTKTSDMLGRSLEEKNLLFRELAHRTRNTLSMLLGMIQLQSFEYPRNKELQRVIKGTTGRIEAVALVHGLLFQSEDLSHIPMRTYFNQLVGLISARRENPAPSITVLEDVENIQLLFDTAIPLGLIVNELLSNSFEHGFPGVRSGRVTLSLRMTGEKTAELSYSDDSIGLPQDFDSDAHAGFGLKLVQKIAEGQLMGKSGFQPGKGVNWRVIFNTDLYTTRI